MKRCRFKRVSPGEVQCVECSLLLRTTLPADSLVCPCRPRAKRRDIRAGGSEADPFEEFPCRFRGRVVRTTLCELCGPEKGLQVPVRACSVYGECVRRKFKSGAAKSADGREMGVCLSCSERKPA